MQDLDQYIDRVKHLPPAPRILPELLALLREENVDSSRIVSLVSLDPSLTAHVLQLCNSAFFATASPADDLQEAVMRLGFKEVYRLVAAVTGSRALAPAQTGYGINQGELWRHSVTSALAAQLIAQRLGEDENLVFTATLLHDLGKIVLSEALENAYSKILEETEKNQQSLLETEKKILGCDHAEVGGRLLERWKFPDAIVGAVWYHHAPRSADPNHRLASFVYLGNMIAHFLGHGFGHQAFALRGRAEALEILELSPSALPHYMIETVEQMTLVEAMFRVAG
jgi:putative nucleotidyltransferase with HDIG domain